MGRVAAAAIGLVAALAGCDREQNVYGRLQAEQLGDLTAGPPPLAPLSAAPAAACGDGAIAAAAAGELVRPPYVQQVGSKSARVLFGALGTDYSVAVTTLDGAAVARVAADPESPGGVPAGELYAAHIGGLSPDTVYCYAVFGPAGALVAPAGFHTAPPAGQGEAAFVSIGDNGMRSVDQDAVLEAMQSVAPAFVLVNGDVAYESGTPDELQYHVFSVYQDMMRSVPWYPAAGNHDYETRRGAPLRAAFSLPDNGTRFGQERWFSFDWGPVHVVVLDTQRLIWPQVEWLERDLAANELPYVVVGMHHPPYSSGSHGSHLGTRARFAPVFERFGVDLVLAGHDHHYERFEPQGGVHYVVSGGGGRGTRRVERRLPQSAYAEAVAHFVYVVADDEALRLWAIDATGQVFDTLVIARKPPRSSRRRAPR